MGTVSPTSRLQVGVDEEVRQLLDLKGLAAQRDLGLLKSQVKALKGQVKAAEDAVNTAPAGKTAAVKTAAAVNTPAVNQRPGTSDGEVLHHPASEEERPQGPGQPDLTHHHHHQMQLDIPSEGIHESLFEEARRSSLRGDQKNPHVRYTPLDLALYVYKTGDEEGVTLAIQELIAEGLMTADEALSYLHDIREHLTYLTQQEGQDDKDPQSEFKVLAKKNGPPLSLTEMNVGDAEGMLNPEMDYEGILEKLRGDDYIYTEYSLEEVIYQLAKILFKQAMHREGDMGSEKALQEVAALLEKEAARGAITPEVEKKVLDVMVYSLVDSLSEKELQTAPGSLIGGSNFKLPNNSPFPLGSSPMIGRSSFKPTSELFQLSKATTKREAPEEEKKEEKKD
nr:uncharacterized protein LOC123772780 [Procambarus clarkii]